MPPPQRVENLSLSNEREMALFPPTRVVDSGDGVDIGATDVPWRDRPRSFIPGAVPRPLEAAGLKESSISAAALET
jgi:hypothetical protein